MSRGEARVLVSVGAAWLDVEKPGWESLVDLDELNMSDGQYCVAGQVFEEEARGSYFVDGYFYIQARMGMTWARSHGFLDDVAGGISAAHLREAWLELLTEHRTASA